jgi:HEAT repeat protein
MGPAAKASYEALGSLVARDPMDTGDDAAHALVEGSPDLGDAWPAVEDGATSASPRTRASCLVALGRKPDLDDARLALFLESLASEDAEVRLAAVEALAEAAHADVRARAPLAQALAHADVDVRVHAARSLARPGVAGPEALGALLQAATDTSDRVRRTALDALRRLRPPGSAVTSALIAVLSTDRDEWVRAAAARALASVTSPTTEAATALRAATGDAGVARVFAALALARVAPDDPTALDVLESALADDAAAWPAALSLATLGDAAKPTLPALRKALSNPRPGRLAAALAIRLLEGDSAKDADAVVSSALSGDDAFVLVCALADLGPASAPFRAALLSALDHRSPDVRVEAARALSLRGDRSDPVLSALRSARANDVSIDVRLAARYALDDLSAR